MGRPPLKIEVSQKDQKQLAKILRSGVQQVRVVLRALALLQLAKGVAAPRIAGVVPLALCADWINGHRKQFNPHRTSYSSGLRPASSPVEARTWPVSNPGIRSALRSRAPLPSNSLAR